MPLVRRIESCGSRSGKTLKPIIVADCGELPSQRQILAKRKAEVEENASLRKDPIQVRQLQDRAAEGPVAQTLHAQQGLVSLLAVRMASCSASAALLRRWPKGRWDS